MTRDNYPQDTWSTQAQAGGRSCQNGHDEYTGQHNTSVERTQDWSPDNITLDVAGSSANAQAAQQYYANRAAEAITQFNHSFNPQHQEKVSHVEATSSSHTKSSRDAARSIFR